MAKQSFDEYARDLVQRVSGGAQQTAQDARAATNDRANNANSTNLAHKGSKAEEAAAVTGSVNEGAGEEKPRGAGIDLSPKQNVTGNALYDQWREAMTGRLGKDFEARTNAAEAATDQQGTSSGGKTKHLFTGEGQRTTAGFTAEQAAQYKELLLRLDGIQAASAFALTVEQSDALEKERAETLSALHQMDADAGRAERAYDARDRAGAFFKSWGKGTAASYTNAAGNVNEISLTDTQTQRELAELKSQLDRAQAEYDAAVQQYGEAGAQMEKNLLDAAQQRYDGKQAQYAGMEKERAQGDEARQISQHLYDTADKLLTESEQQMAKAKQGTSAAAQFALDAAKTGMDIAADTAASAIGVPGLANMAVRVYGSEAQQARLSGDDAQTAAAKGMKAAMIEVLTEKISGPFEKAYGSSLGKAAAATKVGKAVNAAVDKLKSSGLIRLAMGAAGEGFEEGMSDVLNTVADHVAGWDDGTGTIWDDIKGDKEQILYDMLLGAFVGAFGGAGNLARGNANAAAEAAPTQQTAAEVQSAAPAQQTAPAASAESRAPMQYPQGTQGTQGAQYPQGTREVRTEAPGRTKTTREQREAAKAQAVDDFSNAQVQYYEEHGWEAALPKELETKNMGKWVKARTAAILEENAARASREAEAMPQNSAQQPQTRTETQGDNPAPARAQEAKQAGSDALNSALNLNSVETQAEAPAQAQKNTASTQETGGQYATSYDEDSAADIRRETGKFKNVVAGIDTSVKDFFKKWSGGRKSHMGDKLEKLYLGEVTDTARARLSELLGYEVTSTDYMLTNDDVKHIIDEHGSPEAERRKGNAPLTDSVLESLPDVLANPDSIELGHVEKRGNRTSVLFKKNLPDGTAVYVQFDNTGRGTIEGKTLYVKPASTLGVNADKATNTFTSETARPDARGRSTDGTSTSDGTSALSGDLEPVVESDNASITSIPTTVQNVKSENQENAGGTQGRARNGSEDYEGSPKEKERGFSKNVRTDNAMEPKIRESFDTAPETYKQLANKDTLAKAEEIFARGLDEARGEVEQALGAAKSGSKLAPEMVPLARMVANGLSKNGNVESARRILADVATELTAAGQLGQAGRILRDSDPNTALASIQKSIDAINAEFEKQHKRSKWRAELTEAETQEILSTDFTESGAYERIYEKVATRLGKEMPSSVLEKLTEIRRINMLLRPRTQIKNVASNVPMIGLRKGAETLSIGIQSVLTKTGRMKEADRTRGWASKDQRQLARDYYEANKAEINGQSNKWDMKSMLREKRTIFKGGAIEKAVSKMTGKEIDSFGEALRQVTYSCLEAGDAPFVKSAFVDSLSQYCAAKGITTEAGITQEAIDFATANAMEATFKNANVIADIVNKAKRDSSPAVSAAIDVLIPFTTTPANILSLMGDYSPVGFAKLVSKDGPAAKIDAFSKASVGTAMLALGFALRNAGIITGGEDDDKDKAALDKATGQGTYSFPLSIGGSVSYDWAQPVGSLMAFGAEIADAVKGQESWDSALMNAIYTAGDSALNLSLFQNIISVLRGSGKPTQQIIDAIMEGGATQLVPGLAGDIAKIIDGTVRSTYTGGNVFNDIGAKVLSTTPGFSKKLPASVNVRGEENTRGGLAARAFNMLLNPTNYTGGKRNDVDEEIYRLHDATGGTSFFPSVSPYKIEYGNKLYTMNGKDRETFQKVQGQTYYELAKPLLDSEMYKALSDEQKADVLKSIRDYALDEAKRQLVDGRGGEYSNDSWDAISALSKAEISEYLPAAQALKDGKDGTGDSATYDAIDMLLGRYGDLSAPVRDELERKGLNVPGLRYSHALGMGAEDWYSAHEAVAEGEKTLGGTDAAKAISIYNSMEGKSDEEILNAMRAQLMPKSDDGGKQNATVRRAEAYMTVAKNNGAEGNLGEWLTLTAELKDADENDHVSKDDVEKAWANMGLGAKETYAGITLNDFYNITKSGTKSYANNPDYATQIDKIYAELYPDAPSVKAQLSGSVRTSERADDGGKTASGVPRNRDAAADWVMKHSRAAKRRIS